MKIKVFAPLVAVTALVLCMGMSNAIGLPKNPLGGGGKSSVNTDDLLTQRSALVYHCKVATIYIAKSLIEVENAVGNKAAAEKLALAIKTLQPEPVAVKDTPEAGVNKDAAADTSQTQPAPDANKKETTDAKQSDTKKTDSKEAKKDDTEDVKVLINKVNEAAAELAKMEYEAKIDKEQAKKSINQSMLYLGAGILVDTQLVGDAKNQLEQTNSAIKSLSSDPTKLGLVKDLKTSVDVLQFVLTNIPTQLTSVNTINKGLKDYAKANEIETPSDEEVKKLSADMEKE